MTLGEGFCAHKHVNFRYILRMSAQNQESIFFSGCRWLLFYLFFFNYGFVIHQAACWFSRVLFSPFFCHVEVFYNCLYTVWVELKGRMITYSYLHARHLDSSGYLSPWQQDHIDRLIFILYQIVFDKLALLCFDQFFFFFSIIELVRSNLDEQYIKADASNL